MRTRRKRSTEARGGLRDGTKPSTLVEPGGTSGGRMDRELENRSKTEMNGKKRTLVVGRGHCVLDMEHALYHYTSHTNVNKM